MQVMATGFKVRMVDSDGEPSRVPDNVEVPLPARFQVQPWVPAPGEQWDFELFLTLDMVDGELEITRLDVGRAVTGPNVTASTLREVDVSGALAACRTACTTMVDTTRNPGWEAPRGNWMNVSVIRDGDMIRQMGLDGLRKTKTFPPLCQREDGTYYVEDGYTDRLRAAGPSSDETTRAVGWLYKFAVAYELAPVAFIRDALGLSGPTTSRWVKLARQAGMVPASTRRPRSDRRNA